MYNIVLWPDGKRLVSSDFRGTVKFWHVSKLLGASAGENNNEDDPAQSRSIQDNRGGRGTQ